MHSPILYWFSLVLLLFWSCAPGPSPEKETDSVDPAVALDTNRLLQTIALGSCNRQTEPQTIWDTILTHNPDLWIWLGDNIYADTEDMEVMEKMYNVQKSHPEYRRFIASTPVVGIWDDHDYGINDGDNSFAQRAASRDLMLQFLDVPTDAPVWEREGAYQAYTIGPAGKQVKIILLDGRYFRDPLVRESGVYQPNPEGDMLGEAQWAWLEEQLRGSTAQIHLIGCGIQFLHEQHRFEKWANFPAARQRLLDLLAETDPAGLLLLSGDRHIAEFARMELDGLPFPLYELTASGMTHSYEQADEENRYRVGPLVRQRNFGLLQIDWSGDAPTMEVQIRGVDNALLYTQTLGW